MRRSEGRWNMGDGAQPQPEAVLDIRTVGRISGKFFVPRYQRGYRWGPTEVKRLLDDVSGSQGPYSLQPIVVLPRADGSWELVDGQQRLTTIFLIFNFLRTSQLFPTAVPPYTLTYESRPDSAQFLLQPEAEIDRINIDFHHMRGAHRCIKQWFESAGGNEQVVQAQLVFLALMQRVQVIWYQAPAGKTEATELFTRLNVGRIPLTDAELFKALLLSARNDDGLLAVPKTEVALQWDAIEHDFRRPELWAFVSDDSVGEDASRIMLLLEAVVIREGLAKPRSRAKRVPYEVFEALRILVAKRGAKSVWDEVLDLHALVTGWFQDRTLFHRIGWLVAVGRQFADLVKLSGDLTRSQFGKLLDGEIRSALDLTPEEVDELNYRDDVKRQKAERLLLLANVETVHRQRNSSERYPFHTHKSVVTWSLEHIHAQNSDVLTTAEQWAAWLKEHAQALDAVAGVEPDRETERLALLQECRAVQHPVERSVFRLLAPRITEFLSQGASDSDADGDWMHGLGNMALLSGGDNAALSNSVFEVKRQRVLALDRQGQYIPVCTRQVFLKYFTDADAQQVHYWSAKDRESYLDALVGPKGVVRHYLKSAA